MRVLVLLLPLVASSLANTSSRPVLTDNEAKYYAKPEYLQGWSPPTIVTDRADYVVGSGHYGTIQAAVNAAIKAGGSTRKYIQIEAGAYREVVYIPSTSVPLTLYGAGNTRTTIVLGLSANTDSSSYKSMVGGLFSSGDPAYSMYTGCANKNGAIGTSCSSVFWVRANQVQIVNLAIQNTATDGQAVALQTNGDQIQVESVHLLGHQDTLCAGSGGTGVERSIFNKCYIEGDIDFIFGGGTAIFSYCTIKAVANRRQDEATIFAPDTAPSKKYGYLMYGGHITGDSNWYTKKTVYLARAWDAGVPSGGYSPGSSPNGQLVIRETTIDAIINTNAPYTTATSGRAFSGNAASNRNLDDNNYNRFWEYANK